MKLEVNLNKAGFYLCLSNLVETFRDVNVAERAVVRAAGEHAHATHARRKCHVKLTPPKNGKSQLKLLCA
jgi:hypothetical protein